MLNRIIKLATPILIITLTFSGCKKNDPTPQQLAEESLRFSWELGTTGTIMLDNINVSPNYPEFALTIGSNRTYTTTGAGDLFRVSGAWTWMNATTTNTITLDDGKEIRVSSVSETTLVFSFVKTTGNEASGISGDYTITLNR